MSVAGIEPTFFRPKRNVLVHYTTRPMALTVIETVTLEYQSSILPLNYRANEGKRIRTATHSYIRRGL